MTAFPPGAPNFQLPRPLRGVVYFDDGRLVVMVDGGKVFDEDLAALRAQPAGGGESCRKCRDAITGMCNDCAAKVDEERGVTQPQPVAPPESGGQGERKPDGYAYRYPDAWGSGRTVIEFNNGQERNGNKPIEAVPYFFDTRPPTQASGAVTEQALADNVWHALDKVSCPGIYMQCAVKAVHDTYALAQGGGNER